MTLKTSMKKDEKSVVRKMIVGIVTSMLVLSAVLALIAILIKADIMDETGLGYYIVFGHLLAIITGCRIAIAERKENKLITCLLLGAVYCTLMLLMTAIFFGAQYQGVPATMIVMISGCVLAALVNKNGMKAGKTRRSKKRRC